MPLTYRVVVWPCAAQVTLLKIDVDSVDGALLHEATEMISRGEVVIDNLLVEIGDFGSAFAACEQPEVAARAGQRQFRDMPWGLCRKRGHTAHPRFGDMHDLWQLQQPPFGYTDTSVDRAQAPTASVPGVTDVAHPYRDPV